MLPPGRARLATNRLPTGSVARIMTMGIVFVTLCAATNRRVIGRNDHVDVESNQLGGEVRQPFHLAARQPPLDGDGLTVDVPEFAEAGERGIGSRRRRLHRASENADSGKLRPRLSGD